MNILILLTYYATGVLGEDGINLPSANPGKAGVTTLLEYAFGLIAAISFLMIVIGGFRYVISIGDPQKIATARKTITYSLVGLAISLSATAIVAFVISKA